MERRDWGGLLREVVVYSGEAFRRGSGEKGRCL
jgi:hypothetical protein